ncbi:hypothetical protein D3C87_1867080 [compost metagenome]
MGAGGKKRDLSLCHHAALAVRFAQDQGRKTNFFVVVDEIFLFEKLFGVVSRFVGVAGEQPLVKLFLRLEDWFISEQNVQKTELGDISAKNDQTHRERCRQH